MDRMSRFARVLRQGGSTRQWTRHSSSTTAALGFGAARVADGVDAHADALRLALDAGVRVIDTAASYGGGASERLVGRVVRTHARWPPRHHRRRGASRSVPVGCALFGRSVTC